MDEKTNGKRTLEGAIDLLAQRADRLRGINVDAESLLLLILRRDKSADPSPGRAEEPDHKPTMVDILYLIVNDMDRSMNDIDGLIAEIKSLIK